MFPAENRRVTDDSRAVTPERFRDAAIVRHPRADLPRSARQACGTSRCLRRSHVPTDRLDIHPQAAGRIRISASLARSERGGQREPAEYPEHRDGLRWSARSESHSALGHSTRGLPEGAAAQRSGPQPRKPADHLGDLGGGDAGVQPASAAAWCSTWTPWTVSGLAADLSFPGLLPGGIELV